AGVEASRRNCIPESQILLHTRDVMPSRRIVFSTFRGCMSFYTARVISGLRALLGLCPLYPRKRTNRRRLDMSALCGEFNESTQHLIILADEEVCEWRGMHGDGSRRNRRLSCGSAGRAVNVWRTSRERLRGGTRAASIGSWLAMEGLLQRHAGGLW